MNIGCKKGKSNLRFAVGRTLAAKLEKNRFICILPTRRYCLMV